MDIEASREAVGIPTPATADFWWARLRREAEGVAAREPVLAALVQSTVLDQSSLEDALSHRLASRIAGVLPADALRAVLREAFGVEALRRALRFDLAALIDRDPASDAALDAVLYFKGFHALEAHRVAHHLWRTERRDLALYLSDRVAEVFQVEIHPAVPIGSGTFIDHATGISIGASAEIGDNVSMLQGVVLGEAEEPVPGGRRHPRVGHGVLIGAGAKLLGPIEIGHCSRIGAGSVVTRSVPPNTTVAGVPARIVGHAGCAEPSRAMDQMVFDVGL
ncbi:serine O-acetyltransferase EpsC [Aureimonas sp. ME7]|uniref:serine O-acetyltransferase EpsC n=1 Tax=Aureimonas sp. ME7 TaxID=2744252 RepID=UPI0015F3C1C5|nr:serine O-acetyltransferase EpsC [Aureimonas sp. ME7]